MWAMSDARTTPTCRVAHVTATDLTRSACAVVAHDNRRTNLARLCAAHGVKIEELDVAPSHAVTLLASYSGTSTSSAARLAQERHPIIDIYMARLDVGNAYT